MKFLTTILAVLSTLGATAQQKRPLFDSLSYHVEMQTTLSDGDNTPLWLNANRHGLSSLKTANGYLRGAVSRPLERDSLRRWGIGYGLDVALAAGFTSTLVVQQAYAEVRWLHGVLTAGSREYPMELKNQQLSTGSQMLGINARPVPQLRLALPEYWKIPGLKGWLAFKGHVAYGMQTDDGWQKDFTQRANRYTEHTLFHSKAGYLRIGPKNITLELGLEMAAQFGGKSYVREANGNMVAYTADQGLKGFAEAFFSGGSDRIDGNYHNSSGNTMGSWVARFNMEYSSWGIALYGDHYFEDHSAMFQVDYDGYGSGDNWDRKERMRFFLYDLKDMLLGMELKLKKFPWMSNVVVEYLSTKYQSGPVYHDHTKYISDHISGYDDYYNHTLFTGNQHWGMVMGNPLYRSPLYNTDGLIRVENNRLTAWHIGLAGQPCSRLAYRLLATWQRGYGTYTRPFRDPEENVSMLGEVAFRLPHQWALKGAAAFDSGKIYSRNFGVQLTVVKTGTLKVKR